MQAFARGACGVFSLGVAVFGLVACSSSKTSNGTGNVNLTAADAPRTNDVLQHHGNGTRDGLYVDSSFTRDAALALHKDTTFSGTFDGDVYAQPLYIHNGPNGNEAYIVATETNHVTAIDAHGQTIWDKTFGAPATSGLPCGNIRPLGITGTPIIDAASRTIYFDAMTQASPSVKHKIYAISLDDGSTKPGWPQDFDTILNGTGKSPNHNQRGALQLLNGTLYVPYGGHYGDCDPYRGTVLGIPVATPASARFWSTQGKRGGIWAVGGLATDGTSVFGATGNTGGTDSWGGGEAVVRLKAGATFSQQDEDFFAPTNWQSLDDADADIGGANPILVDMPGAPIPRLVFAFGKDANMYVMNRDDLGGLGGAVATLKVASGALLGAGAAYKTSHGQYVIFRSSYGHGLNCPPTAGGGGGAGNIGAVQILPENPPRLKMAWCVDEKNLGGPIVTSTDGTSNAIVWDVNDHLWGYDGDTGQKIYAGGTTSDVLDTKIQYFNSPIAAGGKIAVASKGKLTIYKP